MKSNVLSVFLLVLLCLQPFCANALEEQSIRSVSAFIQAIKGNNPDDIASFILYPLKREAPLPAIADKNDFIKRFKEVFDDELVRMIVNSDLENDWSEVGWRGISLRNGELWLDESGKVRSINYQSEAEKKLKSKLLEEVKGQLHPSLKDFVNPALEWETSKFRIRVDDLGNNKFRYAAWPVSCSTSEKPNIIISGGKIEFEGSGGNHTYVFSNGDFQYRCVVNVIGSDETPPGELEVYKGTKRILHAPVVRVVR